MCFCHAPLHLNEYTLFYLTDRHSFSNLSFPAVIFSRCRPCKLHLFFTDYTKSFLQVVTISCLFYHYLSCLIYFMYTVKDESEPSLLGRFNLNCFDVECYKISILIWLIKIESNDPNFYSL